MSSSREIITLQFGHYANFVGTHWWNLHEEQFLNFPYYEDKPNEIDYDVLYREGRNDKGEVTFTPRLLLADLNGSLKTLPEISDLYLEPQEPSKLPTNWNENAKEIDQSEALAKNDFLTKFERDQKFNFKIKETDIEVWSDFLFGRFHPRTVNLIKNYSHKSPEFFNNFEAGSQCWQTEAFQDDFCNKIRSYAEECDLMQGFHVIQDIDNAFSGLSTSCVEYLGDEYDKKCIISFPVYHEKKSSGLSDRSKKAMNSILLFDALAENSSLFVPMSTSQNIWGQIQGVERKFKYVRYEKTSRYHTSALLASALETFSLQYRTKKMMYRMQDVVMELSKFGKKCASASLLLPLEYHEPDNFGSLLEQDKQPLVSLTPHCELDYVDSVQFFGLRGVNPAKLKKDPYLSTGRTFMYHDRNQKYCVNDVAYIERGLPLTGTYPKIVHKYPDEPEMGLSTDFLPAAKTVAGLHSHVNIGRMFESLLDEEKKLRISKRGLLKYGIELDNFKECLERLQDLESVYTLKRFYDE